MDLLPDKDSTTFHYSPYFQYFQDVKEPELPKRLSLANIISFWEMQNKSANKVGRPPKVNNVLPPKERAVCERFGTVLKELGLTQQSAAEQMGLKQNSLSRILTYRNSPSLGLTLKFIEAFDVNPNYLLTGRNRMFNKPGKSMNENEAVKLTKKIQELTEQLQNLVK